MATTARPPSGAFFDCPHGVAPGRMPKADATELAPKKSAIRPSGTLFCGVPEGFCFWVQVLKSAHFFGEASERRPWAVKREDRPAAFAGRSKSRLLGSSRCRDTAVAYTGEYPIPPRIHRADSFCAPRLESEKPAGDYRENVGGNDCDALHYSSLASEGSS